MPISTVECCDCMDYMAKFPDKFFELCICDPPYGIEDHISKGGGSHTKSQCKFHQLYSENHKSWDVRPNQSYFKELIRVSKNQIICGGNYFADIIPISRGWAIWDKVTDGVTCVNPELIYTSFDLAVKIFRRPQGLNNGFMNKEGKNIHPTQKPIQLYSWLLQKYAKPGDKILDTHMGSQSSRIAAHQMGFDFWGCEIDPEYFEQGCKRFEKEASQQALFVPEKIIEEQIDLFKEAQP